MSLSLYDRADDVLDAEDQIAFGGAALAGAGGEVDFDGLRRVAVCDGVASAFAVDPVGAAAALDDVVAAAGEDRILAGIADDGVGAVGDAVDPVEPFAGRIGAFDVSHGSLLLRQLEGVPRPGCPFVARPAGEVHVFRD